MRAPPVVRRAFTQGHPGRKFWCPCSQRKALPEWGASGLAVLLRRAGRILRNPRRDCCAGGRYTHP
eukprot:14731235-Alexandrium_andersonii.AAC.1